MPKIRLREGRKKDDFLRVGDGSLAGTTSRKAPKIVKKIRFLFSDLVFRTQLKISFRVHFLKKISARRILRIEKNLRLGGGGRFLLLWVCLEGEMYNN